MAATKQRTQRSELTPQQAQAAALVAEGKPAAEVAEEVGVDPSVVTGWADRPAFVAQVNRHRKEIWTAAQDRLRALVPDALAALEQAVQAGDVRAAVEVLKAVGLHGKMTPPSGAVEPERVMVEQAKAWAEAESVKLQASEARYVFNEEKEELVQQRFHELLTAR